VHEEFLHECIADETLEEAKARIAREEEALNREKQGNQ